MPDGHPLITHRGECGTWTKLPWVDAHCAYVLAYKRGGPRSFPHAPGLADRAGSTRFYLVDTSSKVLTDDHLKIPALGDRYFFTGSFDARWQVADPAEVVRNNLDSGDATVGWFVRNQLWSIGRTFDAHDSAGVEARTYATLGAEAQARGVLIGTGLVLTGLAVRLAPDERITVRGVADDDDAFDGRITERRARRLRDLLDGDGAAIHLHLAKNPDDTATVLQMILEAKDKNEQLRLNWLDRMRQDDAIQPADYEQARAAVLNIGGAPPALTTGTGGGTWTGPLPLTSSTPPPSVPPPSMSKPSTSYAAAEPHVHGRPVGASNPFAAAPTNEAYESGAEWWGAEPVAGSAPPEPYSDPTPPEPYSDPTPTDPFGTSVPADPSQPFGWSPPTSVPTTTGAPPASPTVVDAHPGGPAAPWDVRAERSAHGAVVVRWTGSGNVEYRIRCLMDGDRWRVVARTWDTQIEDGGAPPGAVSTYAVSAAVNGERSAEVRSDS